MLVQLVCLDRRYQRMNCYNIREIQSLLKSKYSPSSSDSADVHFNFNDTALGLRYQISKINFLDPSIFTYYRNALTSHPRYKAFHAFLDKPICEFDSVKLLMSKSSLLYSLLRSVYKDEIIDFKQLISTTPLMTAGGLTCVLGTQVTPSNKSISLSSFSSHDIVYFLYSIHPGTLRDRFIAIVASVDWFDVRSFFFGIKSLFLG